MIEIREVSTRRVRNDFVRLPYKIFKNNPNYVPALRIDEKAMFNTKKNVLLKTSEWLPLVAYRDGKPVGRIIGIIQKLHHEKIGSKRARFSHFDVFDDFEAAEALFARIEEWAREKGMAAVHGPLGFNDTDREGMLIEGFDTPATYVSLYNHPYYPQFMERLGYVKDADWLQYRVDFSSRDTDERVVKLHRINKAVMERYNLTLIKVKNKKELIEKYGRQVFDVLNVTYAPLYGTVHIEDDVVDKILSDFSAILDIDLVKALVDENDKMVGFAVCFASISEAVTKSKGRLFPFGIFRLLRALKNYKVVDLGLIGVLPEYQSRGINAVLMYELGKVFYKNGVKYMETNLMLESNLKIQSQLRGLNKVQHKRNRAFMKSLTGEAQTPYSGSEGTGAEGMGGYGDAETDEE